MSTLNNKANFSSPNTPPNNLFIHPKVTNDKNLSISLMEEYLKQTKELLAKLKQALESPEKNYKDLEYYTHTLKGSSASVSAKKLAEFGKTMNDAAKQKDCITIESARVNFALDFLRLENFVKQWKDSL
jgi:HPt (histidine-containing phosphotransfer) domain-containing protein